MRTIKIFTTSIVFLTLFFWASAVHAADLAFTPQVGTITNDSFTVDIVITNNTQPANAVSGSISFPTALLSVASISKAGSIISLWAEEPSYSNTVGTIRFEGVILNPGLTSASGKVLSVRFAKKPQASGVAKLTFSDGAILANDGQATNTIRTLGLASFTLAASAPVPPKEDTTVSTEVVAVPNLVSTTHPNQEGYSSVNIPVFTWDVPAGVTAVRLGYGKSPTVMPIRTYTSALTEKSLEVLADGTYYFAAQFKDASGWGSIARYKFSIDTVAPNEFTVSQANEGEVISIEFNATDDESGIERYEISIDGEAPIVRAAADASPFTIPTESGPGMHYIVVKAVDAAGNTTEASIPVFIPTPPPAPVIALQLPLLNTIPFGITPNNAILVGLASVIILLIALIWYAIVRFMMLRAKVRHDLEFINETLRDDFLTLREHIELHSGHIGPRSKAKAITDKIFKNSKDTIELIERDIEHKIDLLKKKI